MPLSPVVHEPQARRWGYGWLGKEEPGAAGVLHRRPPAPKSITYDPLDLSAQHGREQVHQPLIPSSVLSSSPDPALTAFAQLGLFRLKASRCLISLFDRDNQHIVAEAQGHSKQQWIVGVAVPRTESICEHVILGRGTAVDLPVSVMPDIRSDSRFCTIEDKSKRFYAGVPIRTPLGINIGVFCVFDDVPRPHKMDDEEIRFMQDLSQTIMNYLESKRSNQVLRREKSMVRGLGSFVEGKTSLSLGDPSAGGHASPPSPSLGSINTLRQSVDQVFSKASNIIRQALEVEGVLFLDATVRSFGGLVGHEMSSPAVLGKASSDEGSSDEGAESTVFGGAGEDSVCSVLGFSTSQGSSINGSTVPSEYTELKEAFLQRLLRRYPHGKILSFEADGSAQSDQSSSELDDAGSALGGSYTLEVDGNNETTLTSTPVPHVQRTPARSRLDAADTIIKMFPAARSVAIVPLWDAQRSRWFAGGFFWSTTKTRIFTVEQEINYLRVFGLTAMAEVARLSTKVADRTKMDILGSISHELRSPLHGVVGAVELLRQTKLDDYQGNIARTIQTSGRTLLDTIDHLLDHSKLSYFPKSTKSDKKMAALAVAQSTQATETISSSIAPAKAILPPIQLDSLIEEIVETTLAGHSFGFNKTSTHYVQSPTSPDGTGTNKRLQTGSSNRGSRASGNAGGVQVLLDIQAAPSWCFSAHPGAIRRIVMNLLGNSLKFTESGHIRVHARPESRESDSSSARVVIAVEDTGKGMSEDYLRNHLFTPFSQEDHFAPGTGLGLSLVRKMTSALGGNIKVSSRIDMGTNITVALPLPFANGADRSGGGEEDQFKERCLDLRGKRVLITGPKNTTRANLIQAHDEETETEIAQRGIFEAVCRDWLAMEVLTGPEAGSGPPDFVIYCGCILPDNIDTCPHLIFNSSPPPFTFASSTSRTPDVISAPIGPRKLALAFSNSRSRWLASSQRSNHDWQPNGTAMSDGRQDIMEWAPSPFSAPAARTNSSMPALQPSIGSPTRDEGTDPELPIIVVDDNAVNLKILTAFMNKLGLPFVTATNGRETLDIYEANPTGFRCVLTDISMPVMDGLESTQRLRRMERERSLKSVPVIALTGLSGEGVERDAYASGVDLVLTKPVGMEKLARALGKSREQDHLGISLDTKYSVGGARGIPRCCRRLPGGPSRSPGWAPNYLPSLNTTRTPRTITMTKVTAKAPRTCAQTPTAPSNLSSSEAAMAADPTWCSIWMARAKMKLKPDYNTYPQWKVT
ncbi:hypothetical protein MKZ38_003554 [Zalerion maritima]|uniref:histidine kinase n=1 Tax=Zalerion maritima TaxID=339359 RepID=A0AAD5RNR4_9PEZI|nr:hypothetical protein MKZ38_003554 [Zalerion maritima]